MQYINPYELLQLSVENFSSNDSNTFSKAKRTLLAEIELSENNSIRYNGRELTKSDCLRAIDDLDNRDKKEFHYFIYHNRYLNKFLTSGELSFFDNYQVESIYKLPEFLDFISPFFSEQYDKVLSENYKKERIETVKKILSVKPITNEPYFERSYKSTYAFIRSIDNDINRLIKDIENEQNPYIEKEFKGLANNISEKVNVTLLNLLPSSYFQSLRNQVAQSIRNLARDINNDPYNNYKPAFEIIEIANSIFVDGLVKQTITKGYYTIKTNYEDSIPKQTPFTTKPSPTYSTSKTETTEINEDENNDDKIQERKQDYKNNNHAFTISIILILIIGFFYRPLQYFILSIQVLILLITIGYSFKKSKEVDIFQVIKNSIIFIGGGIAGLFYPFIARIFISYYFLQFTFDFISEFLNSKKKLKLGFFHYLIGALFITFLYQSNLSTSEKNYSKEQTTSIKSDTPKTAEEFYQRGISMGKDGSYKNAIDDFQQAILLNQNYFDAFLASAFYKIRVEDFQGAINDCNKAMLLNENNAVVYNHRGYAKYRLKQLDDAMLDFNKAIEINPEYANAYRNRGEIKYDRNDNFGAAKDYGLAIQFDPQNPSYHFARGLAYYYLKNYNKALDDMNSAIELNPNNPQYYYDRGDTKEKNNDLIGACEDWKVASYKGYSVPENKLNMCTPKVITMINGNISGCSFKPIYASPVIDNYLKIRAGNTDVAVKLINIKSMKCIRYVFINQNTSYNISNIPEGKYYLKIAYGENWAKTSIEKDCQGRFSNNTLFKRSDEILDFNLVETINGWQIPYYELELNVVVTEGNEFNSSNINENDFYTE